MREKLLKGTEMEKRRYKPQDSRKILSKNGRILITRADEPLGFKLFKILKRNYEVTGLENAMDHPQFVMMDLTDTESFECFLRLDAPDVVIHLEKGLAGAAPEADFALAARIGELCSRLGIRFVWVAAELPEWGAAQTAGWLVVLTSMVFGFNYTGEKNNLLLTLLDDLKQKKEITGDHTKIIYPVLMDEAALCIQNLLGRQGVFRLEGEPATAYQWARIAAGIFSRDPAPPRPPEGMMRELFPRKGTIPAFCFTGLEDAFRSVQKQMGCVFKMVYEYGPAERAMGVNVGNFRYGLGQLLGRALNQAGAGRIDCVVPVPRTGRFYAMGLSQALGVPYVEGLLKGPNLARSFDVQNAELRKAIVRTHIRPLPELLEGRSIALVDEAIFTGTTLKVVCEMLRACGVKTIHICIPTPTCRKGCGQYVLPERRMLLEQISEETCPAYFGVKSVTFQSIQAFKSYLSGLDDVCMECFMPGFEQE